MRRVSRLESDVGHGTLSACRAICRCRSTVQVRDWCGVLVDGSALLLGRHARLGASVVRLHVCALRMLRRWRASRVILRLLCIHGWLLLVLCVGILVVDRWLTGRVWRLRVLLHGHFKTVSKIVMVFEIGKLKARRRSCSKDYALHNGVVLKSH